MNLKEKLKQTEDIWEIEKIRREAINSGDYHIAKAAKLKFEDRARMIQASLKI